MFSHLIDVCDLWILQMEEKFVEFRTRGVPVAGVIVEPIQGEGGDNQASPEFFRSVQKLCKQFLNFILIGNRIDFLWFFFVLK